MLDYRTIMAKVIVGKFLMQVIVMVNEVRCVVVSSFHINVVQNQVLSSWLCEFNFDYHGIFMASGYDLGKESIWRK